MGTPASPPKPPSPMEESRAQLLLEESRRRWEYRQEEQRRLEERRRLLEDRHNKQKDERNLELKNEREASLQRKQNRATISNAAQRSGDFLRDELASIDPRLARKYGLHNVRSKVMGQLGSFDPATMTGDPYMLTDPEGMWSRAYDAASNRYRNDMTNEFNTFAREGFETDRFADTMDDDILTEILTGQYNDALEHLQRAQARGQLNDTGYNRAFAKLGERNTAAMGELQDIGMGVLSRYRDDLRGLRDREMDTLSKSSLSNPYDVSNTRSMFDTRANDYVNRLRGDIFKAIGDQQFFDTDKLVGLGGAAQGMFNPTGGLAGTTADANPLLQSFADQEKNKRTVNTSGVF